MRDDIPNSQASGRIVLAVTILGSSMAFIDGTVVNVAFPALQNAFHVSIADVQWVVESYALMLAALLLVPDSESGLASGINNAVSRLAALLAVAVFGAVLVTVFNHSLDHSLDRLALSPALRAQIDAARPQLAAAHNPNPVVQRAIVESFITGYRAVIWIATGLAALSAVIAGLHIESGASESAKQV
jgi:hypothetical protein